MEFSFRAIIIGILLSILLGAANAYVGLKVGMTVSASIPAVVLSFAVLHWFRNANVLENNLIQTAASAGESLAAGMIFTLPALMMMGAWQKFDYVQGTLLITLGGLLGVLIAVPLRQALLDHRELSFPEGVATAQVLKAGYSKTVAVAALVSGALIAAVVKFLQSGLGLAASHVNLAYRDKQFMFAFGADLSPALVAVGYIVKLRIASLMMIGGIIIWLILMPIYAPAFLIDNPNLASVPAMDAAFQLWSTQLRFIGVGAMLVAGLWVLMLAIKPVWHSIVKSIRSTLVADTNEFPIKYVLIAIVLMAIPIYLLLANMIESTPILIFALAFALVASFLFSMVAAYMAGLVGSSNNPISGVTIATIFIAALSVYAILWLQGGDALIASQQHQAAGLTILIAALVCCAAAISGDTMQDLKAGQLVGASPRLQTWMQILGVLAAGLILIPVLNLLYEAYGFLGFMPREAMDPSQALAAPQASLMSSVAKGVFGNSIHWDLIYVGMLIALVIIVIDWLLKRQGRRLRVPVMAVAVGMYLPITLSVPIFLGGFIANLVRGDDQQRGTLFASGLIAGEALLGIVLAIPFALLQDTSYFYLISERGTGWLTLSGLLLFIYVLYKLWHTARSTT